MRTFHSFSEAKKKMNDLGFNSKYVTIGFADVILKKENNRTDDDGYEKENYDTWWTITLTSSYHVQQTLQEMYETNGDEWQKN